MKTCTKCNTTKQDSDFYSRGKNRNDTSPYCKPCLNRYQMLRWKETKLKAIEYKGGQCQDCHTKYPLEVYQFHHLDPSKKEFQWSKTRQMSWDTIVKEIDKCILLCANCHILRHSKHISSYKGLSS